MNGSRKNTAAPAWLTFAVIALAAFVSLYTLRPPAAVPADAPMTAFSSGRAVKHLPFLARAPHPMGTPEHKRVRDYLVQQLTALGARPEIQQATVVSRRFGGGLRAATVQNVVARLPGAASTGVILLACHYDSVAGGPGAGDDAAAVAALLETLHALRTGPALRNDVVFLFTDGEEAGLLGAEAFAADHPRGKDAVLAFNFEGRGVGGPVLLFETSANNGWLVREFARSVPHPFGTSLGYDIYKLLPNDTDFTVFRKNGARGLNFAFVHDLTYYHTSRDTVRNLDERSVQHHGAHALALARRFGNLSLPPGPPPQAGDAVFFNPVGSRLAVYPQTWAAPLMLATALVLAAVLARGFQKRRLSARRLAVGVYTCISQGSVIVIVVGGLWTGIQILYRQNGFAAIYVNTNPWHLLGITALTVAVAGALLILLRPRVGIETLAAAALLWWLVPLGLTYSLLSGGSYLFTWPLLFGALGLGVVFSGRAEDTLSLRRALLLSACAVPGVLLLVPVIYLLFIIMGLDFPAFPAIIVLIVLLLGLLLPPLDLMTRRRAWLLPGMAAGTAVGAFLMGRATSGYSDQRPRPDNLRYCLDADTGKAFWVSLDDRPDTWTAQFLSARPQRALLPQFYPQYSGPFLVHAAPPAPLRAPQVTRLSEVRQKGIRTLRLRLRSARDAPRLSFYLPRTLPVRRATVNGKELRWASGEPGRYYRLSYFAPPPEGIELTLETASSKPIPLLVTDFDYTLPDVPGAPSARRPPDTMPGPEGDGTLVRKTFTF